MAGNKEGGGQVGVEESSAGGDGWNCCLGGRVGGAFAEGIWSHGSRVAATVAIIGEVVAVD